MTRKIGVTCHCGRNNRESAAAPLIHPWMVLETNIYKKYTYTLPPRHRQKTLPSVFGLTYRNVWINGIYLNKLENVIHDINQCSIDIEQRTQYTRALWHFFSVSSLTVTTQQHVSVSSLCADALLCYAFLFMWVCSMFISFSLCHHCQQQKSRKKVFRYSCSLPLFFLLFFKYMKNKYIYNISKCQKASL